MKDSLVLFFAVIQASLCFVAAVHFNQNNDTSTIEGFTGNLRQRQLPIKRISKPPRSIVPTNNGNIEYDQDDMFRITKRGRVHIPQNYLDDVQEGSELGVHLMADEAQLYFPIGKRNVLHNGGGIGVYGEQVDSEGHLVSTLSLVQHNVAGSRNPVVSGSMWSKEYVYQIRPQSNGQHLVTRRRIKDFWDERTVVSDGSEEEENQRNRRSLQQDDPGTLDVMVVYTRAAMCKAANYNNRDCAITAANMMPIETVIKTAVYETNMAMNNTQIPTQFRLVHMELDYDFNEYNTSTSSWPDTLRWLQGTNDPWFPTVQQTRDRVGADFVVLLTNGPYYW